MRCCGVAARSACRELASCVLSRSTPATVQRCVVLRPAFLTAHPLCAPMSPCPSLRRAVPALSRCSLNAAPRTLLERRSLHAGQQCHCPGDADRAPLPEAARAPLLTPCSGAVRAPLLECCCLLPLLGRRCSGVAARALLLGRRCSPPLLGPPLGRRCLGAAARAPLLPPSARAPLLGCRCSGAAARAPLLVPSARAPLLGCRCW